MSADTNPCVVILGAGPAGLGAAYFLALRGIRVVVLEKLEHVGGNAGSFQLAGIPVDYGSHRFHPAADPDILKLVQILLGQDLLKRPRHGRIRLMGRWLHFPLNTSDLVLHAPPGFVFGVIRDLLIKLIPAKHDEQETFASILQHGLGTTICEQFYFPYARKIWGMEPDELSPIQAKKRVSSGSIGKMLRKLLPSRSGTQNTKGVFYYPRGGFGQISEALSTAASEAGANIMLGCKVRRLIPGSESQQIEFTHQGQLQTITTQHIWSTIPVTVLTRLVQPSAPEVVLKAAHSLRFRGMLLIYLVLDTAQFTAFDAHYLPGADIRITRLSEPKNYSARTAPLDTTVLCAELPCQPQDDIWQLSDKDLGELVLKDLAQAGIPVNCAVKQVAVRRLPQAYPLYPAGFEQAFESLDHWTEGLHGVLTFGRQGLFAHDNTHHALYMARAAAECLADDGGFDHEKWTREREVFASHVVED